MGVYAAWYLNKLSENCIFLCQGDIKSIDLEQKLIKTNEYIFSYTYLISTISLNKELKLIENIPDRIQLLLLKTFKKGYSSSQQSREIYLYFRSKRLFHINLDEKFKEIDGNQAQLCTEQLINNLIKFEWD